MRHAVPNSLMPCPCVLLCPDTPMQCCIGHDAMLSVPLLCYQCAAGRYAAYTRLRHAVPGSSALAILLMGPCVLARIDPLLRGLSIPYFRPSRISNLAKSPSSESLRASRRHGEARAKPIGAETSAYGRSKKVTHQN